MFIESTKYLPRDKPLQFCHPGGDPLKWYDAMTNNLQLTTHNLQQGVIPGVDVGGVVCYEKSGGEGVPSAFPVASVARYKRWRKKKIQK